MISENVSTLWAKYDRETEQVLALPRHLEDAACVARILWKTWLSGNIVASLSEELGDSILAP